MMAAVTDAMSRGVPHPHAVRQALQRQRQTKSHHQTPPPLGVALSAQVRARDIAVRPHSLDGYDRLTQEGDDASN
jgi:hypothetical protein